jgi:protein subunit release factor A
MNNDKKKIEELEEEISDLKAQKRIADFKEVEKTDPNLARIISDEAHYKRLQKAENLSDEQLLQRKTSDYKEKSRLEIRDIIILIIIFVVISLIVYEPT